MINTRSLKLFVRNKNNLYETPKTQLYGNSNNNRRRRIVISSVIGGIVGFALGVTGVVALLMMFQGAPGLLEIAILVIGISVVLVLPGVALGACLGALLSPKNS